MKKILKHHQFEEATYTSDFQGEAMPHTPHIEVKFDFGYGSKYDGDSLSLHLTDSEILPLLKTIQTHGSQEFKESLPHHNLHPNLLRALL
jgi:hypothetical protein